MSLLKLAGMLTVVVAVLRLFYAYVLHGKQSPARLFAERVRYSNALLLSFELLVGAGILSTVLHPSWSDIGKLAAIAALRTLIKRSITAAIRTHAAKGN